MSDPTVRENIFASLDNALANGFDMRAWSVEAVTDDLMTFDADAWRFARDDVKRAAEAWLAANPPATQGEVKPCC